MIELPVLAATLESLPDVLHALLSPVDDAALRTRPEPGEWCPLEVIGHLIACDSGAFRDRIRTIVDQSGSIPAFRPWDAIKARDFAGEPLDSLLDELRSERVQSAELIRSLGPRELDFTGTFAGEDRRFAAGDFVHEWPFHDQDHLQQILACLKPMYLPHMTSTMRDAIING